MAAKTDPKKKQPREAASKDIHALKRQKLREQRAERLAKVAEAKQVVGQAASSKLLGFVTFIREKGVVGLAVGLAIGTAASGLVTQIVNAVITPTIGLLVGPNGLAGLNTTVDVFGRTADYAFGDLLDAMLKFIAIAAVIYFVVLGLKLDRLDVKKES